MTGKLFRIVPIPPELAGMYDLVFGLSTLHGAAAIYAEAVSEAERAIATRMWTR